LLLRVCLRSTSRREPRRWLVVFAPYAGKANSVSPVPARIALQGGETREHRCEIPLPRLSFTRGAMCPCPSQEKSCFRTLAALAPRGPQDLTLPSLLTGTSRYAPPSTHTERRVLAEPFKDNKKQGSGQRNRPDPWSISPTIRSISASRHRSPRQNPPVSWRSACCPGYARCPATTVARPTGSRPRYICLP